MADRLRDVGLPDAALADDAEILLLVDERARRQVDDLRLRYLWVEAEVEVLEALLVLEAGAPEPEVEPEPTPAPEPVQRRSTSS